MKNPDEFEVSTNVSDLFLVLLSLTDFISQKLQRNEKKKQELTGHKLSIEVFDNNKNQFER